MSLKDKIQEWSLKKQDYSFDNLMKCYQKGDEQALSYLIDKKQLNVYDAPEVGLIDGRVVVASKRYVESNNFESKRFDIFNNSNDSVLTLFVEQQKEHFIAKGFRAVARSHGKKLPDASRVVLQIAGKRVEEVMHGYFGFDEKGLQELGSHIKDPKIKEAFDMYACRNIESRMSEKDRNRNAEVSGAIQAPTPKTSSMDSSVLQYTLNNKRTY